MDVSVLPLCYLIWASIEPSANAANILGIFTNPSPSHFWYNHAIMRSLADAGHNITFVGPFPQAKSAENFRYIDTRKVETEAFRGGPPIDFRHMSWQQFVELITNVAENECYHVYNIKAIRDLLNSPKEKYDLMFVELLVTYEFYLPIAHKLGIPVIGTLAIRPWFTLDQQFGDQHALIYPFLLSNNPARMGFFERLQNVLDHLQMEYMMKKIVSTKLQKFYDLYLPDYDPSWNKNISFFFTNWDPNLLPRATVPTVAGIAGIHIQPAKPLPQDIREFVEGAQDGVILFTIGSYTSTRTFESGLVSLFLDVFTQLPQRVIWKFDDDIPNLPRNILLKPWVPQRDILAQKNVKAFITHTGISGIWEAIYEAKPMIMMPIFGDQLSNAAILAEMGVGERLANHELTQEALLNTIKKVVNDPSYSERIRALSRAFKDRPMSPAETVVYWTEYVLRHNGTAHLRPVAADMPLYSYLLLDIFLFIAICVISISFVLYYVIKKMYICCRSNGHTLKKSVKAD